MDSGAVPEGIARQPEAAEKILLVLVRKILFYFNHYMIAKCCYSKKELARIYGEIFNKVFSRLFYEQYCDSEALPLPISVPVPGCSTDCPVKPVIEFFCVHNCAIKPNPKLPDEVSINEIPSCETFANIVNQHIDATGSVCVKKTGCGCNGMNVGAGANNIYPCQNPKLGALQRIWD